MRIFSSAAETFVVDGDGKSATDFAANTLLLFLDNKIPCTGDENAIFACLRRVMENDILDVRRSATAKTTTKVQPVSGSTSKDGTSLKGLDDFAHRDAVDKLVEANEFKQRFYELLEVSEPELYELVYAVFEENALTPRAIAEVIGTDSDDVQNRRKRLRTFIAKHNLMKTPTKAST
jgi:DNA-directed RNA polymerase specialized sigma24 family protein